MIALVRVISDEFREWKIGVGQVEYRGVTLIYNMDHKVIKVITDDGMLLPYRYDKKQNAWVTVSGRYGLEYFKRLYRMGELKLN